MVNVTALGKNAYDIVSMGQKVALMDGRNYTLTFWAKAAQAETSMQMAFHGNHYLFNEFSNLSTDWQKYTWNFATREANPAIKMNYSSIGKFWIDDIQINQGIPALQQVQPMPQP